MNLYFDIDGVLADFDSMTSGAAELNHPSSEMTPEMREAKKKFWLNIEQNPIPINVYGRLAYR